MDEYTNVLMRQKFGFDPIDIENLIDFIEKQGHFIQSSPLNIEFPDKYDLAFLEVAVSGEASVLITGNKNHFIHSEFESVKILNPSEFLNYFSS